MANISTDVSTELNITARRGDTFILDLSVADPNPAAGSDTDGDGLVTLDMTGLQHTGTSGTTDTTSEHLVIYGVKMTIADNSGEPKLTILTTYYEDQEFNVSNNISPTATQAGVFYGESVSDPVIDLSSTSSEEGKIRIKIPADYMIFEAGNYKYDLQVRKKTHTGLTAEITTWLRGTFNLNADITSGTD